MRQRSVLLGGAIALGIAATWIATFTLQKPQLSDGEMVALAADFVARTPEPVSIYGPGQRYRTALVPPYGSGPELMQAQPQCCFIGKTPTDHGTPPSCGLLRRHKTVTIRYLPHVALNAGERTSIVTRQIGVGYSGQICK